jgi:hypothetical protein
VYQAVLEGAGLRLGVIALECGGVQCQCVLDRFPFVYISFMVRATSLWRIMPRIKRPLDDMSQVAFIPYILAA